VVESPRTLKKDWVLTQEAFDRLLSCFDSDREIAGQKYELIRLKLIRFFEWRDWTNPQDLTDETINRVARRLCEGEIIHNLTSYVLGAARHLASEQRRELQKLQSSLEQLPNYLQSLQTDKSSRIRLECCEACLSALSEENRKLIQSYYASDKRTKIEDHRRTAEQLGISLNSLRIRAHRIKLKLGSCIDECQFRRGED
jgi:DNA-directed RNA polymerase specialized sigma24 family protein